MAAVEDIEQKPVCQSYRYNGGVNRLAQGRRHWDEDDQLE